MLLTRNTPCLWASRTQLWRHFALTSVRWRSGSKKRRTKLSQPGLRAWGGKSGDSTFAQFEKKRDEQTEILRREVTKIDHEAAPSENRPDSDGERNLISRETPTRREPPLSLEERRSLQKRALSLLMMKHVRQVLGKDFYKGEKIIQWGVVNDEEAEWLADDFALQVQEQCHLAKQQDTPPPLYEKFRHAFVAQGSTGLDKAIRLAFSNHLIAPRLKKGQVAKQTDISNLTFPAEWYPATRALQRKVYLHVGPTNSGKTYMALKRLETAKSGIFAGPLRLLAHEVYSRFNAKNVPCALVTGEERRMPPGFDENQEVLMRSCTVEMVPLQTKVDVAVIDEIQMIGDDQRGWAWTQAFLGIQAKELHLCGEMRTISLIKDLCAMIGDKLEVHQYQRLSPLEAMDKSLDGNLHALEKGDAVIAFSRLGIHALKVQIERETGKRCAVVYGSLPPETRAQQADLFNDPNNDYDILVASDAIGMGLNLSIKRIVFERTWKHDGVAERLLYTPELKQIAGRAGRFRTAAQAALPSKIATLDPGFSIKPNPTPRSVGLVTCLYKGDLDYIRFTLNEEPPPITTAGILPTDTIVQQFASYFPPQTPFSFILSQLHDVAAVHPRFHLCGLKDATNVADMIQDFDLTIPERLIFCAAPVMTRQKGILHVVQSLADCVVKQSGGDLLDLPCINLGLLDLKERFGDKAYLEDLEMLHNSVNLYLWLSYRFAGVFRSVNLGFHIKKLVQEKIERFLAAGGKRPNHQKMAKISAHKSKKLARGSKQKKAAAQLTDADSDHRPAIRFVQSDIVSGQAIHA